MKNLIKTLSIPEISGKKIGIFRILCSVFGGLSVAYFGMTLLVLILPGIPVENAILPLVLNTLAWASCALWISLAYTKLSAILRSVVPTILFLVLILVYYYS